MLDMDGTLYLGDRIFPDTVDFLEAIKQSGANYIFLTNNSSRGTQDYVRKLRGMGISVNQGDFFTSTHAAISFIINENRWKKIYALGTSSFKRQLLDAKLPIIDVFEKDIDCLLLGYDTELTYQKLVDASQLLDLGVDYLATNPDWVCPTANGYVPDCGAIAQALEHATGRLPKFLGKPQPDIALLAMQKAGVSATETVLVGDRIYTDIACAKAAGIDSVLVLSGETKERNLSASVVQPDYVAESISDFLPYLL